jgi:hypothetical protein
MSAIAAVEAYTWTCHECGSTGLCWSSGAALRGLSMHTALVHTAPQVRGQLALMDMPR